MEWPVEQCQLSSDRQWPPPAEKRIKGDGNSRLLLSIQLRFFTLLPSYPNRASA